LSTDGYRVYLAYVDSSRSIKLTRWEGPEKKWINLQFPEEIKTECQPSICGMQGDWLTVAFSDNEYGIQLIATQKDLQRAGAWPNSVHDPPTSENYWTQIDFLGTKDPLTMIQYQNKNLLMYSKNYEGNNVMLRIGERDGSDERFYNKKTKHLMLGSPMLTLSNNTIYMGYVGTRIAIDRLRILNIESYNQEPTPSSNYSTHVFVKHACYLTNDVIGDLGLSTFVIENGVHPKVAVSGFEYSSPNHLFLRLLSMDSSDEPLDYSHEPY
jgi:hypothetical protein